MADINIIMSPLFLKTIKKLNPNQKKALDDVIKDIIADPEIGEKKIGDLSNVYVHKFKVDRQKFLLAYIFDKKTRTFVALGLHENFYRDLKKYLK